MKPIYYSLAVVFAFAAITLPLAHASESIQLDTTLVGNSAFDLNWEDKDQLVRVYAQFANYDMDDKYFEMNVIQSSTGNTVASSQIHVYSTAKDLVDFNSFVSYMVNDRDICTYDMTGAQEDAVCLDVMTGDYELQVTSRDGTVSATEAFSISDSRA